MASEMTGATNDFRQRSCALNEPNITKEPKSSFCFFERLDLLQLF